MVAGSSAVLATVLGCLFALFASALQKPLRHLATGFAIATLVIPPFLVTNAWLQYFGLAGSWRSIIDFNLYSLPGTVLLITVSLWPIPFLLLLGSLLRTQPLYLEQEPHLRGRALFQYILWPGMRGSLGYALALSFVFALNNFSIPVLLQTKVYTEEVWLAFSTRFDYATALKLSWPLVLGPLLLLALLRFRPARFVFRAANFPSKLFRERLGLFFPVPACAAIGLIAVSLALPAWQLFSSPRTWTEFLPAIAAGKSAALAAKKTKAA